MDSPWGCKESDTTEQLSLHFNLWLEVMKIMVTSFKRPYACSAARSAPNRATGHCCPNNSTRYSWTFISKSGSVSCGVTVPFSWVLVLTRFCCALQESVSPVLCKFWWLYGGVSGNLLQEGLCHTQVYCAQSPCPRGRPLLTCTSSGDTQTQFWLSLCWVSGSWCTQSVFEPSECLWQVWSLILNMTSPFLPSCWGFSALEHGVSSQSHSSAM